MICHKFTVNVLFIYKGTVSNEDFWDVNDLANLILFVDSTFLKQD